MVCPHELKCAEPDFPAAELEAAGYGAVWTSEGRWNGVAILAREAQPVLTRAALPGDPADRQQRYIEAAVQGILIASVYAPNGNPCPGPKFDYKLHWLGRLAAHAADILAAGVPAVLAGDYNVVPEPRDIYPTSSYDDDALVQPEAREAFRRLMTQGWCDSLRHVFREQKIYTFWDYRRRRWRRDAGFRNQRHSGAIDENGLAIARDAVRFREAAGTCVADAISVSDFIKRHRRDSVAQIR